MGYGSREMWREDYMSMIDDEYDEPVLFDEFSSYTAKYESDGGMYPVAVYEKNKEGLGADSAWPEDLEETLSRKRHKPDVGSVSDLPGFMRLRDFDLPDTGTGKVKKLKRDLRMEALKRIEDAARTVADFNKVIETGHFTIPNAYNSISNVRHKVGRKVMQLQKMNPDAKESYLALKEELKQLGVTPDTTYLYIQGHHLYDNVVSPMLNKVCDRLRREREVEIYNKAVHNTQMRNELSCYENSIESVKSMLKKNTGYTRSMPYRRLKSDLEHFLHHLPARKATPEETLEGQPEEAKIGLAEEAKAELSEENAPQS